MPKLREKKEAPPTVYATSVVMAGAELGVDSVVGAFCFVAAGARIGRGVRIQSHTSVWAGVTLEDDVFVGPGAMFTNVRRPRAAYSQAPEWDETVVEQGATIGAHATLVAPVRVGAYAMIGAGAVVTRDVPAHALVVGIPARVKGWACSCGAELSKEIQPPARVECRRCGRFFEHDPRAAEGSRDDDSIDAGLRELPATGRGGPR